LRGLGHRGNIGQGFPESESQGLERPRCGPDWKRRWPSSHYLSDGARPSAGRMDAWEPISAESLALKDRRAFLSIR
jgi:hypothetical protein